MLKFSLRRPQTTPFLVNNVPKNYSIKKSHTHHCNPCTPHSVKTRTENISLGYRWHMLLIIYQHHTIFNTPNAIKSKNQQTETSFFFFWKGSELFASLRCFHHFYQKFKSIAIIKMQNVLSKNFHYIKNFKQQFIKCLRTDLPLFTVCCILKHKKKRWEN